MMPENGVEGRMNGKKARSANASEAAVKTETKTVFQNEVGSGVERDPPWMRKTIRGHPRDSEFRVTEAVCD